jgi:predicted Fe-Mo cluster-binding NifX family protein
MNQRIAFAIEDNNKYEMVAEHFGRCSKFNVCELDDKKTILKRETYFNPLLGEHNGACQIPDYVKQFNVDIIIAGGMGQKAISKFLSFGIEVITAPGLVYEKALNMFIKGKLSGYKTCNQEHEDHP